MGRTDSFTCLTFTDSVRPHVCTRFTNKNHGPRTKHGIVAGISQRWTSGVWNCRTCIFFNKYLPNRDTDSQTDRQTLTHTHTHTHTHMHDWNYYLSTYADGNNAVGVTSALIFGLDKTWNTSCFIYISNKDREIYVKGKLTRIHF